MLQLDDQIVLPFLVPLPLVEAGERGAAAVLPALVRLDLEVDPVHVLSQLDVRVEALVAKLAGERSVGRLRVIHQNVVPQVRSGLEPLPAFRTEVVQLCGVIFEVVARHGVVAEDDDAADVASHLVVVAVVVRVQIHLKLEPNHSSDGNSTYPI